MRLNLNDNIKVKLTEHGKDIYYHQYDKINAFFGRELCKPSYPKVDEDGYTTFQLWCFMQLYGVHIGMALPDVIEPIDIVFDEPTIEPERKWILCSERLPEEGERVLCTHLGGLDPNRQVIEHIYEGGQFVLGWEMDMNPSSPTFMQRYMGKVVAWMPMPEPYKENK